jgi:hypothetical protein
LHVNNALEKERFLIIIYVSGGTPAVLKKAAFQKPEKLLFNRILL